MAVNRRTQKATKQRSTAAKAQAQPNAVAKVVKVESSEVVEATVEPAASEPVDTKPAAPTSPSTTAEGSHAMSQEEVVKVEPKPVKAKAEAKGAIATQSPSLSIWNRPIMQSEVEVVGTLQMAGERPVAASEMAVFGTLLNGRPIEATGLKVYDELPGARPIFMSDFHAVEGLDLPGGRPVMESPAALMKAAQLPGGRPIFSNDIDDAYELMGFID